MYTVTKEILYMPGLITNYLFGERSYQLLSPNYLKEIIRKNPNAYHMGLQGPDIFFYYLNPYMRKRKNNICNILHEKSTGTFLDNLLEYTIVLETEDREICLAYIAGFFCHYALDTHTPLSLCPHAAGFKRLPGAQI